MQAHHLTDGRVRVVLEAGESLAHAEGPVTLEIVPRAGLLMWDALRESGTAIMPVPAVPEAISDRQFAQALALAGPITQGEALAWAARGELPAVLGDALARIPEAGGQRFAARMLLSGATTFERGHPVVAQLGAALGYDTAALDALWRQAAAL